MPPWRPCRSAPPASSSWAPSLAPSLAIAHERGCEADLAALIDAVLDAGGLPDLADLRARFTPDPEALPQVIVTLTPLSAYDALTATAGATA